MPDPSSDVFSVADRYPGSKQLRRAVAGPPPVEPATWDAKPVIKTIKGQQVELFTIGQLGAALGGRAAVTMRLWEREGVIPKARMRLSNKNGVGGRRYFTRAQVQVCIEAATRYGMLQPGSPIDRQFTRDVVAGWAALEA